MKKILFITILFVGFTLVNAQSWRDPASYTAASATSEYSLATDTVATSATVYLTIPSIYGNKKLSISPYALNISGTTGVSFTLQVYVANQWVGLTASNSPDMIAANDTITLLTATSGLWTIDTDVKTYRVKCTADGTTQSSIVAASYILK